MVNGYLIELRLTDETVNSTVSSLRFPGNKHECFTVEDGHRDVKEYGNTRIPAGTYKLIKRRHGGFYNKYKKRFGHDYVWQLENVPGFTDILIHIGNYKEDTKGCLLLNNGIHKKKNWSGIGSTAAYLAFFNKLDKINEQIYIQITR